MAARLTGARDPRPCRTQVHRLGAWLDGELGPLESAEVRDHLMACPACRGTVQRWTRVREELALLEDPGADRAPDPVTLERMARRFEAGLLGEVRAMEQALRVWQVAAATLLLLGLAILLADRALLPGRQVAAREPGEMERRLEELFSRPPAPLPALPAPPEAGR